MLDQTKLPCASNDSYIIVLNSSASALLIKHFYYVFLPLFTFTNTSHYIFHNEVDQHYESVCFCQSVVSRAVCFPGSSCGICCGFQ